MLNDHEVLAKEPFFRITKRAHISNLKSWGIRLIAVVLSLIVCAFVIMAITGENPFNVYLGIIDGAIGKKRRLWVTIRETLTLLIIAVGLTPAFKMRFWNIGAEGQVLMGGLATAAVMIYLGPTLPNGIVLLLVFMASILAGLLWGIMPA
jgi:simple sugar transport system permease protein